MSISDDQLVKILQEAKLIPEDKLKNALSLTKKEEVLLQDVVLELNLISDEYLGRLIADFIKFPYVNLSRTVINEEVLKIIPEIVAKKQKIIAFKKDEKGLHLGMADPSNLEMIEFVKKKVGVPVIPYYATKNDLKEALSLYRLGLEEEFSKIIDESTKEAKAVRDKRGRKVKPSRGFEPPIIKIVDTILTYADQNKASDVHIEPRESDSIVRFRIDGILHDVIKLPTEIHSQLVTRIKVIANLRIDEHQAAQDGKIRWAPRPGVPKVDIRVSIVPIIEGEKVVLRLLSEKSRQFGLKDLGLDSQDLKKIENAYNRSLGMVLSTGPTGCGKTTTQYAILKVLNIRDVNIMTIENPVEYDIEGVNQIQIQEKSGLTFAKGLRSIVRQDPDIILVGEIRDNETASIAINAAMTGHLVLSTLHTNDAATTLPRLLEMDVEPFLVASTVTLIIAQRLVRKICQQCRVSFEVKVSESEILTEFPPDLIKKQFGEKEIIRVYQGKGCPVCHQTGYLGRIGIFEVLLMDDEIRNAIVAKKDAATIKKIAVKNGMKTMTEDGLAKVKTGLTTLEELLQAIKE